MQSTIGVRRRTALNRRRKLRKERVVLSAVVAFVFLGFVTMHTAQAVHEGGRRRVAEQLTRAIIARDKVGMAALFVPSAREAVRADLRLGSLTERLQQLGSLREVRVQDAPRGGKPWTLLATFTHGTQIEHVQFEGDNVVAFIAGESEMVREP